MHGGMLVRGRGRGVFRFAPSNAVDRRAITPRRSRGRHRGRLLALAAVTAGGLLAGAPPALADTVVTKESGNFGIASGDYIHVRDAPSFIVDTRIDVDVLRDEAENEIVVTDTVGRVRSGDSECFEVGATVRCPAAGLEGLKLEGSTRDDVIENRTDLTAEILGDRGNDQLQGGSNRDRLNGQEGNDRERGGAGADIFRSEPGDDLLDGQDGDFDTVSYAGASGPVALTLGDPFSPDGISGERDNLLRVENAIGSPFLDSLAGSSDRNVLRGGAGRDTLSGLEGDDVLDGGDDGDLIRGGSGTGDLVTYADRTLPVTVTLDERAGDGNATTDGSTEIVRPDVENVEGGAANDTLIGQTAEAVANDLRGNGGKDTLGGGLGDDVLGGGPGDDTLNSGPGNDALLAADGNDRLDAGSGNDTLQGDNGDDSLDGGPGSDLIDGGLANEGDLVSYVRPPDGDIVLEPENITVTLDGDPLLRNDGGASDGPENQRDAVLAVERVRTGPGDDTITGTGNGEEFDSGEGKDRLEGNAGNDTLIGGPGPDGISGGLGDDALYTGPFSGAFPSLDGAVDGPLSCGTGPNFPGEDFPTIDHLFAEPEDIAANPQVLDRNSEAFCERITT